VLSVAARDRVELLLNFDGAFDRQLVAAVTCI
jgi:hypothetical protein